MTNSRLKKTSSKSGFFPFLKQNWYILIGMIIVLPILYKYLLSQITSIKDAQVDNEVQQNWNKVQTSTGLNEVVNQIDPNRVGNSHALSLAIDLGTYHMGRSFMGFEALSVLNPSTWTENEDSVFATLKSIQHNWKRNNVKELYSRVYTKGRDLQSDCKEYLPSKMYNAINWN